MDIRNWPLDEIMQLPIYCFGRRFPVFLNASSINDTPGWDISEVALPEKCVIWEFVSWVESPIITPTSFRLALGDQLPTTVVMMDALEPLFFGFGHQGAEPRNILYGVNIKPHFLRLRLPVMAGGRRPILEVIVPGSSMGYLNVVLVVSSIPTKVPDCLIPGRGRRP